MAMRREYNCHVSAHFVLVLASEPGQRFSRLRFPVIHHEENRTLRQSGEYDQKNDQHWGADHIQHPIREKVSANVHHQDADIYEYAVKGGKRSSQTFAGDLIGVGEAHHDTSNEAES